MTTVELLLVAARALQFGSAMILLGTPLLYLGLSSALTALDCWLRRLLLAASIVAVLSSCAWLDLEAVSMGGGWHEAHDWETIKAVLFLTNFGKAWQWHLGFAMLALAWICVPIRGTQIRLGGVAIVAGGLAGSMAWAGHAVMHPGAIRVLNQVVHLVSTAVWIGSLPSLWHLVARARRDAGSAFGIALKNLLPRYAAAGNFAVSLVVLTGLVNSWYLLGRWSALLSTAFGRVLLVKIGLVLLMLCLAAFNRFRLTPAIVAADDTVPIRSLWISIAFEQALGVGVIVAVSFLGMMPPAIRV